MASSPPFCDPQFLQRTLTGYAQAMASLAATVAAPAGTFPPGPGAVQASLAEAYQRLFAAASPAAGGPPRAAGPAASAAAFTRYQAAAARWAEVTSAIARDASGRLAAALQETGPGAPPITSLAALQALWIDCGEAAYAEAARRDEFADAQADLLMATVELSAPR